ncbi:MAG: recombination mediator RecR [Parcubacteria group bacterium]|jgi:recombination protein RecR
MYPKSFKKLIENFSSLPSVGPKMAERLVLFLFKQDKEKLEFFAKNLEELKNLQSCRKCFNISEDGECEICKNASREQKTICVVEEPLDIISIEKTGIYKGLYHVLGGVIFGGSETKDLKINELLLRIKKDAIEEIILATNPTTEGDATALYLKRQIKDLNVSVKISRLAKGLATGGDIEYADEATLSAALTNRRELV